MSIQSASSKPTDPLAVFHRLEQFYTQMQTGTLDAAMSLYSSDAEVILPGQPSVKGAASIRSWWEQTLQAYEFRVSPQLIEATDLGNAVMLQGCVKGKLISRTSSDSVNIDSWFVQIYRKQEDGRYLFWRGASGPNPKNEQRMEL